MKPHAWLLPAAIVAATGAALLLTTSGSWSQTPPAGAPAAYQSDSSRTPIPVGSTMALYLYGSYTGKVSGEAEAQAGYQPNGNVTDAKGKLLGKLVDSAGRDITAPHVNGDYRLRGLDGTEIGTTVAPSSTAGVRSLTLHPVGTGWPVPVAQNTPTNGPVTTDQGGTTTGSAISSSIRAGVGGGLSETDRNTSTGTSSNPDPNNQPGPSGPVYSSGGTVVAVPPSRSQTPNSSNPNPNPAAPAPAMPSR